MYDAFSRMENLLGTKGVKRLGSAKIAVFGILSSWLLGLIYYVYKLLEVI